MITHLTGLPLPAESHLDINIRVTQPLNVTSFSARQRATHGKHPADRLQRRKRTLSILVGREGQTGHHVARRQAADELVDPHRAATVGREGRVG